jgi:uncharacterized membrane protein YphA (DoxX/SURF4 family)
MARRSEQNPGWVDALLDWQWTWLAARVGLTGAYIFGGLTKSLNYPAAVTEQEHLGLHPGWLWARAAILVEISGPVMIIFGRHVWPGTGALGVLTTIATVSANDFWTMHGHDRFVALNTFFEHIGLVAAFVTVALIAEHVANDERRDW